MTCLDNFPFPFKNNPYTVSVIHWAHMITQNGKVGQMGTNAEVFPWWTHSAALEYGLQFLSVFLSLCYWTTSVLNNDTFPVTAVYHQIRQKQIESHLHPHWHRNAYSGLEAIWFSFADFRSRHTGDTVSGEGSPLRHTVHSCYQELLFHIPFV